MTVGELIKHLQTFDPNLPIIATWEGTLNTLACGSITLETRRETVCVLVDVEGLGDVGETQRLWSGEDIE